MTNCICSLIFLVWALWHALDDTTSVGPFGVTIWLLPHPRISTALMKTIRLKQHCLQLCINLYIFLLQAFYSKIHHLSNTILHPGPKWHSFHILTTEDIDDIISHFFMVVCENYQFIWTKKRKLQGCCVTSLIYFVCSIEKPKVDLQWPPWYGRKYIEINLEMYQHG